MFVPKPSNSIVLKTCVFNVFDIFGVHRGFQILFYNPCVQYNHRVNISLGFYSIININSEYQRLFFLPSTECHNGGPDLASEIIEVLKNKNLSKNEISDKLFEFSKTRCDNNIRELKEDEVITNKSTKADQNPTVNMSIMLQDSLSATTVSLIKQKEESSDETSQQVIPTLIFTETEAGPHYISISNKENEETSVTNTYTTERTTDQSVFLVRIQKSNVLDIDADILIVALFLLCVILLIILLCCCLMHLACIRQCFNCSNQTIPERNLRNIAKKYDTGEITKVSI